MARSLTLFADGGSRGNPGPAAYGAVVFEESKVLIELSEKIGVTTNNVAEYSGLIAGLRAINELDETAHVHVKMDSKLIVEQMSGNWKIKNPEMKRLAIEAKNSHPANLVRYEWIPRDVNVHADRLVNEALDGIIAEHSGPLRRNYLTERLLSSEIPTMIYLVRHGQTALTPQRKFSGIGPLNPELTPSGLKEADLVASEIARIKPDVLISSPLQRTKQTAEAISKSTGLEIVYEEMWKECDFGIWDGLSIDEVKAGFPDEYAMWVSTSSFAPPGGESYDSAMARALQGLQDISAEFPHKKVCVVTHNGMIKTALAAAIKAEPSVIFNLDVSPASISCISIWPSDGLMAIRSANERGHLR
ncbi:MAG: histidine phosphatase family protein [Candidatus Nanopelagicaceae bacterium]